MKYLFTLLLFFSILSNAQEVEYFQHTSQAGAPYVCRVDGVEQTGTNSFLHKANQKAINLKIANPDSSVICERTETIVTTLTSAGRDLLLGNSSVSNPPVIDPDPDPIPSGESSFNVRWTTPTQNTDGTDIDNLIGFNIYYGTEPGIYQWTVSIDDPTIIFYTVTGLEAGNYYVVMTAVNSDGIESDPSNEQLKSAR